MNFIATIIGWLGTFSKANIAFAVGFLSSAILPTFLHVTLTAQDQLELSGVIGILLHQVVYWTPNGPRVPTGDFAPMTGGAGQTSPPTAYVDKGV